MKTSITINHAVLISARESRGLTQKELADKLNVNQGWLSRVESGQREISEESLKDIADLLSYPIEFFFQEDKIYGFGPTELFNRRRQDIPMKKLQEIHAQINIRRIQLSKILKGVDIGDNNIPNFELDEYRGSVDDIAKALRTFWRLPPGPVNNLIEVIEENGGIVIPFDFNTPRIDAMCITVPGMPPLFFINPDVPGDRLRFTLSHELAHVVMHQRDPNPDMERQADRFAAQFLMPDNEIGPFLSNITLPKLTELKIYWKVSMQALIKRSSDLDLITQRQARSLWMKMGALGYKMHEPIEIPPEIPTLYKEIINVYKTEMGYSLSEFSKLVNMHEQETEKIYYKSDNRFKLVTKV